MKIHSLCFLTALLIILSCSKNLQLDTPENVNTIKVLEPIRHFYGEDKNQFGELWLPDQEGPSPVVLVIHGGCWRSQYDYTLMDSMAYDLSMRGYAVWNIEYRRTEDNGGGWPGTFLDVGAALNHLKQLKSDYPIDLDNLLITGHSAGGHLALWLATAESLASTSDIYISDLLKIKGVVSLAGITDLNTYYSPSGCGSNTENLVGGKPGEFPMRYRQGSPISHVPIGVPVRLINGEEDNIVSIAHITPFYEKALNAGDDIKLITIPEAAHFEVITPGSNVWQEIVQSFEELIDKK